MDSQFPQIQRLGLGDLARTLSEPYVSRDRIAFAVALQEPGVPAEMPDDIRAVSRALVTSVPLLSRPSTIVSCRSP